MTYASALSHLAASRGRGIVPGLSRITRLLAILGNPQDGLLLVHVAGTNGKGSTSAFLESVLRCAGHKTGFFSSPWLVSPREMFQVAGVPVTETRFAEAVAAVVRAAEGMTGEQEPGAPTEYEMYAAMAFWLFREEGCRAVVLETCMGGRLDTTNAYAGGNLAVITRIGLDHTAFLGTTLADIARHKAGIFRAGCRGVSAAQPQEVENELHGCARDAGTDLSFLAPGWMTAVHADAAGTSFTLTLPQAPRWSGAYRISLVGRHQAENAALAVMALATLAKGKPGLTGLQEAVHTGLAQTRWPCRFEVFEGSPRVVLDGAHNPDGVARCVETFREVFPHQKATIVFGVLRDKDVTGMLRRLSGIASGWVLLTPDSPRAMAAEEVAACLHGMDDQAPDPQAPDPQTGNPREVNAQEANFLKTDLLARGAKRSANFVETLSERACCVMNKSDTMKQTLAAGLRMTPAEGVLLAVGSLTWVGRFREMLMAHGDGT